MYRFGFYLWEPSKGFNRGKPHDSGAGRRMGEVDEQRDQSQDGPDGHGLPLGWLLGDK